jgi:hypothetical protein
VANQKTGESNIEVERPARATLTIVETDHDSPDSQVQTITFDRCIVTSTNRDVPSDDSSTTSFDWDAEDITIKDKT